MCSHAVGQLTSRRRQIDGHDLRGLAGAELKTTNKLRKFIEVERRQAVKIGELERNTDLLKVVRQLQ